MGGENWQRSNVCVTRNYKCGKQRYQWNENLHTMNQLIVFHRVVEWLLEWLLEWLVACEVASATRDLVGARGAGRKSQSVQKLVRVTVTKAA